MPRMQGNPQEGSQAVMALEDSHRAAGVLGHAAQFGTTAALHPAPSRAWVLGGTVGNGHGAGALTNHESALWDVPWTAHLLPGGTARHREWFAATLLQAREQKGGRRLGGFLSSRILWAVLGGCVSWCLGQ